MAESRVKKTLLNARVNLLFYLLALTFSFFSRKIFLDYLGADFIGLTGTLYNLLGFLNLAELGMGNAIAFVLYKTISNKGCLRPGTSPSRAACDWARLVSPQGVNIPHRKRCSPLQYPLPNALRSKKPSPPSSKPPAEKNTHFPFSSINKTDSTRQNIP